MQRGVFELPRIFELLTTGDELQFLVVDYPAFVRLGADDPAGHPPDMHGVLDANGEHAYAIVRVSDYQSLVSRFEITGAIDEDHYLQHNGDVKAAIAQGQLKSATQHYVAQGYFEKRHARPARTRKGRVREDGAAATAVAEMQVQEAVDGTVSS